MKPGRNIARTAAAIFATMNVFAVAGAEYDFVSVPEAPFKNVTCGETTQEEIVVVNAKNVTMDGKPIPSLPGKAPSW